MSNKWWDTSGNQHSFDTMSHGHLSNIYYYTKYINPVVYKTSLVTQVMEVIISRFDGVLLPYDPRLPDEFKYLHNINAFKPNTKDGGMDIVIDYEVICNVSDKMYNLMVL